ncbi:hypothetical protein ACSVDA_19525 [Cytobacillus sp. Hm23]
MASYKVSTSPCGCKSLVKEEVKEIVSEVTTCDCCTRDLQANLLSIFPPGSSVLIELKNGEFAFATNEFIIQELRGTVLIGTVNDGPAMILLCDIATLGNPSL